MFNISTKNLNEWAEGIEDFGYVGIWMQYKAAIHAAKQLALELKYALETKDAEKDPWTDVTGSLRESFRLTSIYVSRNLISWNVSVGKNLPHAKFVECKMQHKVRRGELSVSTEFDGENAILGYFVQKGGLDIIFKEAYIEEFNELKARYSTVTKAQAAAMAREARKYNRGKRLTYEL